MTCPSSNMQYNHLWVSRFEMSFRTTSYEVMTTSYDCSFAKSRTRSLELPVYKTGRKLSEYPRISWYQWLVRVGGHTMRDGRCTESEELVFWYFSARSKCLLARMQIDWRVFPRPISRAAVRQSRKVSNLSYHRKGFRAIDI